MTRKMKDSGIKWIGEIPEDWEITRNKYIFNKKNIKVGDKHSEYQLLSLTKKGIVEKDIKVSGGKLPASFSTYQAVETNDIVLCLFDIDVSAVFSGISKFEGMISSAYDVFSVNSNMSPDFYDYYFQLAGFNRSYIIYSKTLRKTINEDNFRSIFSIVPPLERQVKIARKLDQAILKIENIINETQQSIEELKAYKQSLITETVTKGLNPDAPMKDSGIDWVGSMPTTWERVALKRLTVVTNGREIKTEVSNNKDSIPVYGTGKKPFKYTDVPLLDGEYIIFGRKGTIGEPYRLNDRFWIVDTAYAAKNTQYSNLNYLYYLLTIFPWELFKTQTAIPSVVASEVIQTRVPYPDIEIQNEIVEFLDNRTRQIDNVINKKQQMLKELESYKQSLIYEYVTGKKEVE